jgi:uncharacterized damage-inducible protein DinB
MLTELRHLSLHMAWADEALLEAIGSAPTFPIDAARELAHILGADENWLARLERRTPRAGIWPDASIAGLAQAVADVERGYTAYLEQLTEADLHRMVAYVNTAGISFENSVRDILYHVFLHAHYHRGKVNLLLRQAGIAPAPMDYISYIRGFPTAVTKVGGAA